MSNHKSIWNRLTKKELVHVIEDCLVKDPIKRFKETRNAQIEMEKRLGGCACRQCRLIAKKLKLVKEEENGR